MKLDENYSLTHDSISWVLHYHKEGELNKKGTPKVSSWETYHVSCKQALEKYFDSKLKDKEPTPEWVSELYRSIELSYLKLKNL